MYHSLNIMQKVNGISLIKLCIQHNLTYGGNVASLDIIRHQCYFLSFIDPQITISLPCCCAVHWSERLHHFHIAVTQLHINLFIKDRSKFKKLKIIFLSIVSDAFSLLSDLVVYLTFKKVYFSKEI